MFPFGTKGIEKLLKKAGLKMYQLEGVERVIIEGTDERIILVEPTVIEIEMPNNPKAYQVLNPKEVVVEKIGEEGKAGVEISEEDVKVVVEQTGCSEEKAKEALKATNGDIAEAILKLQEEGC